MGVYAVVSLGFNLQRLGMNRNWIIAFAAFVFLSSKCKQKSSQPLSESRNAKIVTEYGDRLRMPRFLIGVPPYRIQYFTRISVDNKNSVYSILSGDVIESDYSGGFGNHIKILSHDSISLIYCHLDSCIVDSGRKVKSGELIGLTGNTGFSSSPSLAIFAWIGNKKVNPCLFFDCDQYRYKSKDDINE